MALTDYQLQKALDATGARLHLAINRKLNRTVVLKRLKPEQAADAEARARFLAGAQLQAGLNHPNIAEVIEVGTDAADPFLATEYLRGGDLEARLAQGLTIRELVAALGGIARALDYTHARGVIHRDVKPANILFREDGTAVLADFGIAMQASTERSLSASGTVVGSAAYMSPEQAAGEPLDGRADLYNLGVVLFQALSGEVPFAGADPRAVAARHIQDPIPRLPPHLEAFQPVIDRILAKQAAARYPDGAAFAVALTEAAAGAHIGTLSLRTEVVSTQEIRAVGAGFRAAARDASRVKSRSSRIWARRWVRVSVYGSALVLVLGGLTVLVEESETAARMLAVAGLARDPLVDEAWNNARSLRRDPNQSLTTVVAGYRRVLSLDPGFDRAQEALEKIGNEWKADIERALAQGNVTLAANKLAESLQVFPSDPVLAELAERINNRRAADTLVNNALAQLRTHGTGNIAAATLAIRSYQEVLRLVPEHPVAQAELDVLADYYAGLASAAADAGEIDEAIDYLDRASAANSRLPVLAGIRERIREGGIAEEALGEILLQASRYRAEGALIDPPGANAAELYHRVLATDPENPSAIRGVEEVVTQLIASINQYLTAGDLVSAGALVSRAAAIGLDQTAVDRARERLDAELARFAAVARNLEDAEALFAQGLITAPAERNAVLLLSEVERLDPGNQAALALRRQCASRLAAVAEEAHAQGLTRLGKEYLELALSVTPDVEAWRVLRARWESDD
jgi:tetratricopeptide (TPR) repeat protein